MNILFWKDVSIAIAVGSMVIDILNKAGITYKVGFLHAEHIPSWLHWIELGMLTGGLAFFIYFSIRQRFYN